VSEALGRRASTFIGKREVGTDALKLKYLCSLHNNALSEVDEEAGRFFREIYQYHTQPLAQFSVAAGAPQERHVKIDGTKLERWAVKTFFNTAVFDACRRDRKIESAGVSGSKIARYVFGREARPQHVGFYACPIMGLGGSFKLELQGMNSQLYRVKTADFSDEFQFPAYLRIDLYGYRLDICADLTTLPVEAWNQFNARVPPGGKDALYRPYIGFWRRPLHDDRYMKLRIEFKW
jgi:hypothetical protein